MIKDDYVLVIPSWYPSKVDLFNGDFNQRTVTALSLRLKQIVIYVVPDKTVCEHKVELETVENLITVRSYIPKSALQIIDFYHYFFACCKLIKGVIKEHGKPLYIHTYVFFPAGLISFYFAKKLKLKSVLTEHWSIIYPDNEFSISKRNWFFKALLKNTLRSFDLILPVVEALKEAVDIWAPKVDKVVVSNVVDTDQFFMSENEKYNKFTFLHVSCMEAHKNPLGILRAFESEGMMLQTINLKFIGPVREELLDIVQKSPLLKSKVEFLGEMPNSDVARIMQKSHVLVMNSFYESQPCVILEALCCGLPVVSTNVGGISEVVNASNGVLFKKGKITDALEKAVSKYSEFDVQAISLDAKAKFSKAAIAEQIVNVLERKKILSEKVKTYT